MARRSGRRVVLRQRLRKLYPPRKVVATNTKISHSNSNVLRYTLSCGYLPIVGACYMNLFIAPWDSLKSWKMARGSFGYLARRIGLGWVRSIAMSHGNDCIPCTYTGQIPLWIEFNLSSFKSKLYHQGSIYFSILRFVHGGSRSSGSSFLSLGYPFSKTRQSQKRDI